MRALPQATLARLAPHLHDTDLIHHTQIYRSGEPVHTIYFVDRGMISLLQTMRDGRSVEVGVIGIDGMTSANALFGGGSAILDMIVQMGGRGRSIGAEILIAESRQCEVLSALLQGAVHLEVAQIAQTAACNRLHSLEQRCCRWLLTAQDNAGSDTVPLTHDFLAMMLGVQRPGVTIAARALQGDGLIDYTRGRITILDRPGLMGRSCECHATIRAEIEALFEATAALQS